MMHSMKLVARLSVFFAGAMAAACGQDRPAQTPATDPSPAPPMGAAAPDMGTPASTPSATASATPPAVPSASTATTNAPAPQPMTDGQIVAILGTANSGEITQAQEALKKAKSPKVKGFAQHMVTDHGQAGKDLGDIQKKGKIDPSPNDMSRQIDTDGKGILASLQSMTAGADFDRKYMDAQVTEHRQLLDALDTKLVPSAQSGDLKAFLQKVRDKVADHLKMATDIQSSLK